MKLSIIVPAEIGSTPISLLTFCVHYLDQLGIKEKEFSKILSLRKGQTFTAKDNALVIRRIA